MTHEEEQRLQEMYYDARFREVDLRRFGFSNSDLAENAVQWTALMDFCRVHGIATDEEYWQVVLPAEERVCEGMKEFVEQMNYQPGKKRWRCSPQELADIMSYGPLPCYPRNVELLVAIAHLCERQQRDHDNARRRREGR